MAESPSHKLGQYIGMAVENAVAVPLRQLAIQHGLYLDRKGPRPGRTGSKVTWTDRYGNAHDLDFVLERDGTPERRGTPLAFIEVAWRRYTKHSRNKAQEIHGAIVPLRETYQECAPFLGAVLAGEFTAGSLQQMRSHGFHLLHLPYDSVCKAFGSIKVEIGFEEDTPLKILSGKVRRVEQLKDRDWLEIGKALLDLHHQEADAFFKALSKSITRKVGRVLIIRLHGTSFEFKSTAEALASIKRIETTGGTSKPLGYEAIVDFTDGDRISGRFNDLANLEAFLARVAD